MRATTETRLARLETSAAASDRQVRVFFCTVREGRKAEDQQDAFAALGDEPGDGDILFRTIYERRDRLDTLPDVIPRASVGHGW